jgi:hypothetical protein
MTRLRRVALLLATALALVAGSGCGSSDTKTSNDYVGAINKAQTDFAASVTNMNATPAGTSSKQAAGDVFANLNTAIDKVISDLKAVKAPDKVKDLHNRLISQIGTFNGAVQKAGAALKTGDPQKILKAQSSFATNASTIGTRLGRTIQAINTKLQG